MTPEDIAVFWNELRSEKNQQILPNLKSPDPAVRDKAWREALMVAFLNHVVKEYLDTFKPQG